MSNKKWKVIGISGCTCAGKTTVVESLLSLYPGSVLIQQDNYFWDKNDPHHITIPELNHHNWECLQSIDWDSIMSDINKLLETEPSSETSLFLIEGHIIYNYPDLQKLIHKKFFITLTEEECYKRRNNRVYDPPDVPNYFEHCIWPMYFSNLRAVQETCSDVIYLDGTQPSEEIIKDVIVNLKDL